MTVERCMAEGLVGSEGFAVDASLIRADVYRQRSVPGEEGLPPETAGRTVAEYLDVLDNAAFGGATPVGPKRINLTDPAARWTAATREAAFYAYSTNYLIDLDYAVIVDVEATTSVRQAEVTAQRRKLERTQGRFGLWPERLEGDAAYSSAPNLAWLVEDKPVLSFAERGIEPHIPVFDKSARSDHSFARSDFTFDHDDDSYTCPGGKRLRPSNRNFKTPRPLANADGFIRYRARQQDCSGCNFRQRCTPRTPARKIMRSVHEGARHGARYRHDRCLCDLTTPEKEGRDALRPPQAHLEAGPLAPARSQRSKRRVPPCRRSPRTSARWRRCDQSGGSHRSEQDGDPAGLQSGVPTNRSQQRLLQQNRVESGLTDITVSSWSKCASRSPLSVSIENKWACGSLRRPY